MKEVVAALTRFQAMNPPTDELHDSQFFLGVAYNTLKKHDLAVDQLTKFVSGDKKSHSRDYGMTLLAQSLEQTGAYDKALAVPAKVTAPSAAAPASVPAALPAH
jgi:hypothetical protein